MFFGLLSCSQAEPNARFEAMLDKTLDGSIPQITASELLDLRRSNPDLILLDSREIGEFTVSHLEGATWIGFDDFEEERVAELPRDGQVVVYCSIGRRSEILGEKLTKLGFTSVLNLRGGIFDWANRELPMVDSEGETTKAVHPFNRWWGRWLLPTIERRYEPGN